MTEYIICDLDGTLFNLNHRLPMLKNCKCESDYDKFHKLHTRDRVYQKVLDILDVYCCYYNDCDVDIIFITGRHEKFRDSTIKQLESLDFHIDDKTGCKLYMKSSYNQYTQDFVRSVLKKIFREYGKRNCLFVLDDRPATVKIYRDAGLLCLQVKDSTGFLEDR